MKRSDIDPQQLAELQDLAADLGRCLRLRTDATGECELDIGGHRFDDLAGARAHLDALATHRARFASI